MYKVAYSIKFYIDIWFIKSHISLVLKDEKAAETLFILIMDKADSLCDFPERYPKITILNRKYHRMPVKNFNIYYCVDKVTKTVTIARVLYSGRDINQVAIN